MKRTRPLPGQRELPFPRPPRLLPVPEDGGRRRRRRKAEERLRAIGELACWWAHR